MSELLLEIRTGGYPASEVATATRLLKNALVRGLRDQGFAPLQSAVGFTNRRMMVLVRGLQGATHDRSRVVAEVIESAAAQVEWRRSVRWSAEGSPWVRPVAGVLALFDGVVVPVRVGGATATESTVGHPTLSPRRFLVEDGDDYGGKLAARGIEVRPAERLEALSRWVDSVADDLGGRPIADPELMERITCSCESPGVFSGSFPVQYLQLPRDLILAGLRGTLQAFAVEQAGELLPRFIGWMDRPDDPQDRVRRGHELAAAACLQNLSFLFERDQSEPLAALGRRVAKQEWLPGTGTYGDKISRLRTLGEALCDELGWEREAGHVAEACGLLFADRDCRLVRELPELRGIVGGLLARDEGFAESVWKAIYEHRATAATAETGSLLQATALDLGSPTGRVGSIVALVDRVDNLVGRLVGKEEVDRVGAGGAETAGAAANRQSIDDERTRRRLARGIVRLLIDGDLHLDLDLVLARSVRTFSEMDVDSELLLRAAKQRIDHQLRELLAANGFRRSEIAAVVVADGSRSLPRVVDRLTGLRALREAPELRPVAVCARRLLDVLHESPEAELDVGLLVGAAEKDLYILYQKLRRPLEGALASGHYREWLRMLASLSASADRFLRETLVRDEIESVRQNRLALLQAIHRLCAGQIRLAELVTDIDVAAPAKAEALPEVSPGVPDTEVGL